ncbi:hypothetical protein LBMAG26_00720 [Bacteroidota bacterium]|nr:hypothetical protein LBMAG26_00720 [Bacteroidota bacterium]
MRNMGIGNFRQIIFVFCLFINALELVAQSNPSIDALGDGSQKIISDTAHHQTASLLKMKTKWEFSTNVTLALSRFTGNVSRNLNDDPYLIMVRKIDVDQGAAWRLGVNGFRTNSQSNFPDRVSSENWASLVIGREWRSELQQGAFIYGGIDSRGIFRQSHSEATQFNDLGQRIFSITDAKEYGGSVGGICGFGWRFQDRIAIYTEALLNAQYTRTDRTFSVNGSITTLENKNNLKIVPMVPIALFLTIKF